MTADETRLSVRSPAYRHVERLIADERCVVLDGGIATELQRLRPLKGEAPPPPVEVTIDVPVDAYLPTDYLARDDVRMEAYRRLAAVTSPADVDDIRDEWQDRYGPPPAPAAALLDVARLRAECVRTGVRSLSVQRGVARLTGLGLRESQKIRLRRLVSGAVAKDDGEVAIPVAGAGAAVCTALVELLGELLPAEEAAPLASAAP